MNKIKLQKKEKRKIQIDDGVWRNTIAKKPYRENRKKQEIREN